MHRLTTILAAAVVTTAVAASALTIDAQQPAAGAAPQGRGGQAPPPQNLQVLPKDISRQDLQNTMRAFTFALGVNCDYCHVTQPARDFASDAKPTKKTARLMLQMSAHVNEMIASGIGKPAAEVTRVQCATCHRGKAIPETPTPPPPAATAQR